MLCLPLSERCTGGDIFKALNDCFTAEVFLGKTVSVSV
jgi:hypothetical protein